MHGVSSHSIAIAAFFGLVATNPSTAQTARIAYDPNQDLQVRYGASLTVGNLICHEHDFSDSFSWDANQPLVDQAVNYRAGTWAQSDSDATSCGTCPEDVRHYASGVYGSLVAQYAVSAGSFAISFSATANGAFSASAVEDCCLFFGGGDSPGPNCDATGGNNVRVTFDFALTGSGILKVVVASVTEDATNCRLVGAGGSFVAGPLGGSMILSDPNSCGTKIFTGTSQSSVSSGGYSFLASFGCSMTAGSGTGTNDCEDLAYEESTLGFGSMFVYVRFYPGDVCPGDANGDGTVDQDDIDAVLFAWGTSIGDADYNPDYDVTGDGQIGQDDLDEVLYHFDETC